MCMICAAIPAAAAAGAKLNASQLDKLIENETRSRRSPSPQSSCGDRFCGVPYDSLAQLRS
jgi:hypothetical protein